MVTQITNGSHIGDKSFTPCQNKSVTIRNKITLLFCNKNKLSTRSENKQFRSLFTTICFSHGQLYATLSRAGIPHKTKVVISNVADIQGKFVDRHGKFTRNVVYTEVLYNGSTIASS